MKLLCDVGVKMPKTCGCSFQFLLETVMEYNRLEKIEISGINGPRLSAQVVIVFDDFNQLFKHLTEKQFDCLNPDDTVRELNFL